MSSSPPSPGSMSPCSEGTAASRQQLQARVADLEQQLARHRVLVHSIRSGVAPALALEAFDATGIQGPSSASTPTQSVQRVQRRPRPAHDDDEEDLVAIQDSTSLSPTARVSTRASAAKKRAAAAAAASAHGETSDNDQNSDGYSRPQKRLARSRKDASVVVAKEHPVEQSPRDMMKSEGDDLNRQDESSDFDPTSDTVDNELICEGDIGRKESRKAGLHDTEEEVDALDKDDTIDNNDRAHRLIETPETNASGHSRSDVDGVGCTSDGGLANHRKYVNGTASSEGSSPLEDDTGASMGTGSTTEVDNDMESRQSSDDPSLCGDNEAQRHESMVCTYDRPVDGQSTADCHGLTSVTCSLETTCSPTDCTRVTNALSRAADELSQATFIASVPSSDAVKCMDTASNPTLGTEPVSSTAHTRTNIFDSSVAFNEKHLLGELKAVKSLKKERSKDRVALVAKCTEPRPGQTRYWTQDEHDRFLEAVSRHGEKAYVAISNFVETRTPKQVRTHAQKFQMKMARLARSGAVLPGGAPPPHTRGSSKAAKARAAAAARAFDGAGSNSARSGAFSIGASRVSTMPSPLEKGRVLFVPELSSGAESLRANARGSLSPGLPGGGSPGSALESIHGLPSSAAVVAAAAAASMTLGGVLSMMPRCVPVSGLTHGSSDDVVVERTEDLVSILETDLDEDTDPGLVGCGDGDVHETMTDPYLSYIGGESVSSHREESKGFAQDLEDLEDVPALATSPFSNPSEDWLLPDVMV